MLTYAELVRGVVPPTAPPEIPFGYRYCGEWTPGTRPPAACGTDGGYRRHRRLGIPIDGCGCHAGHAQDERRRAARRRRRRYGTLEVDHR